MKKTLNVNLFSKGPRRKRGVRRLERTIHLWTGRLADGAEHRERFRFYKTKKGK